MVLFFTTKDFEENGGNRVQKFLCALKQSGILLRFLVIFVAKNYLHGSEDRDNFLNTKKRSTRRDNRMEFCESESCRRLSSLCAFTVEMKSPVVAILLTLCDRRGRGGTIKEWVNFLEENRSVSPISEGGLLAIMI